MVPTNILILHTLLLAACWGTLLIWLYVSQVLVLHKCLEVMSKILIDRTVVNRMIYRYCYLLLSIFFRAISTFRIWQKSFNSKVCSHCVSILKLVCIVLDPTHHAQIYFLLHIIIMWYLLFHIIITSPIVNPFVSKRNPKSSQLIFYLGAEISYLGISDVVSQKRLQSLFLPVTFSIFNPPLFVLILENVSKIISSW